MKGAARRAGRYGKKITGAVLPGQRQRFAGAVGSQIAAESLVKALGVPPGFQNYYMIFAKELLGIRRVHSGTHAQSEACVAWTKWLTRGLDVNVLNSIMEHYNFSICPEFCAWSYKRKLTFSGNVSATNLDNFPVLVHLTVANFDFSKAKDLGEDIRFMDSDTCPGLGTPLDHEIEKWDKANDEAWLWVKVPRIDGGSATDYIYMFYGNAAAADGQNTPGVWSEDYEMVQHMYDSPTNAFITGSTTTGHLGTKTGANNPLEVAGKAWKGQRFNGTTSIISVPDHATLRLPVNMTVSAWYKRTSFDINRALVSKPVNTGWPNYVLVTMFTGDIRFYIQGWAALAGVNYSDGAWHSATGTYDGANIRIYGDGDFKGIQPTVQVLNYTTDALNIGRWRKPNYNMFDNDIDEVRLASVTRTPDWIKAQHLSVDETLITYGAEESV